MLAPALKMTFGYFSAHKFEVLGREYGKQISIPEEVHSSTHHTYNPHPTTTTQSFEMAVDQNANPLKEFILLFDYSANCRRITCGRG
jgi:hypothetical protein